MAFPYINQLYAGLNPNDATVNQWIAKTQAPPVAAPSMGPPVGTIVMPGQPVNVNAPTLMGVPAQFQAKPAPLPQPPAPMPVVQTQGQMVASGPPAPQGPVTQTQDATVGLSVAPLQYGVINTPGRAAGELNTMGPNQERLLTKAAGTEGNAQVNAAERVATAMVAQQAPLDERAQYMAALAEREARDQTGRNEQNRQRLEDYEREAKELREMKVDPDQAVSGTQQAVHGVGAFMGTLFDALAASKGGHGNASAIVSDSYKNRQAMGMQAQQQNITNRRGYLEALRNVMQAQRETQGDQVASNQRQAALMREATGAHLDQAGVGVAMQEALARGDVAQAQILAGLDRTKASKQVYIPASGGGQVVTWKDPATGVMMQGTRKEFQSYVTDMSKDVRGAGLGIARDTAKADADGKGKKEEDFAKRFVPVAGHPNGGYMTNSAEEGKDHREARLASAKFKQTIEEMKRIRGEISNAALVGHKVGIDSDRMKKLQALQGTAVGEFNKMNKLGALDKGTIDIINQTMGDPTGFKSPTANYDAIIERLDADLDAQARSATGYVRPQIQQAAPSFKPVGK